MSMSVERAAPPALPEVSVVVGDAFTASVEIRGGDLPGDRRGATAVGAGLPGATRRNAAPSRQLDIAKVHAAGVEHERQRLSAGAKRHRAPRRRPILQPPAPGTLTLAQTLGLPFKPNGTCRRSRTHTAFGRIGAGARHIDSVVERLGGRHPADVVSAL